MSGQPKSSLEGGTHVSIARANNGVATLCIDRESKRNALNRATLAELCSGLDALSADEDVRVIVLRGAGDRAFCGAGQIHMELRANCDEGRPLGNWEGNSALAGDLDSLCQAIAGQISVATLSGESTQPTLSIS